MTWFENHNMNNKRKSLTIIVLAYNSAHIIRNCLEKINFDKYEVIVVDNASKDEMTSFVEKNFSQAKLIKLDKNVGYGNGNNVALEQVNTDFALILNPDAFIYEQDIDLILEAMIKDETIASAGPVVLKKEEHRENQESFREWLNDAEKDLSGIKDMYYEKLGDNITVRFVSGAVLFLRMSIFKKIGFFDPNIFLFYEDDEICRRAKENGYKNIILLTARAFHISASSSAANTSLKNIYIRNWHLNGWSKLYWKGITKGKFSAKKTSVRLAISRFIKALFFLLTFNPKEAAKNFGASCGSFAFLIGRKSFKK
jgi:N-acetylglucosaminyl-diphospho-decaprenol L-rhamnosyltransferase